jgi:glycosyltransferase involved in cell wall biosynthesis
MRIPTLNFVSGIATPPVNQLLAAVAARSDVRLRIWYAEETDSKLYPWQTNPTHEVQRAEIYGTKWPSLRLLKLALAAADQGFMVVGWANPTTRVLLPALLMRKRRFAFFTDCPADKERSTSRELLRNLYIGILRRGGTVFGVGRTAVDYFSSQGFPVEQLCNLPLPTELPESLRSRIPARDTIRNRLDLSPDSFFVVTGSRLVESKGFDLLLSAVARLDERERARLKVLIVGSGPEKERLERQARDANLTNQVRFEPWMEYVDFCGCIGAADVVVHPARADPYGGITLTAVGLGIPVVGTRQAGSAVELVQDGKSGFLYDAEDVEALKGCLRRLLHDQNLRAVMAEQARATAARWTAVTLADTLVRRLFQDGILRG